MSKARIVCSKYLKYDVANTVSQKSGFSALAEIEMALFMLRHICTLLDFIIMNIHSIYNFCFNIFHQVYLAPYVNATQNILCRHKKFQIVCKVSKLFIIVVNFQREVGYFVFPKTMNICKRN